jgi:hypothetical protein
MKVDDGSGPGVGLHLPNGCSTYLTGHGNVEIGGLDPATTCHSILVLSFLESSHRRLPRSWTAVFIVSVDVPMRTR